MLVTLKEIMNIAEEKNIAVGSFNASCLEAAEAELETAEELKLPIIILAYLSTIDEVMFVDEIDCTDLFEEERITAGENDFVIYEETKRIIDNLKNVKLVIVDGGNS